RATLRDWERISRGGRGITGGLSQRIRQDLSALGDRASFVHDCFRSGMVDDCLSTEGGGVFLWKGSWGRPAVQRGTPLALRVGSGKVEDILVRWLQPTRWQGFASVGLHPPYPPTKLREQTLSWGWVVQWELRGRVLPADWTRLLAAGGGGWRNRRDR